MSELLCFSHNNLAKIINCHSDISTMGPCLTSSNSLLTELKQSFPSEVIAPFGEVTVIPNRAFKPEWRKQLEAEGVKIYAQAYHGEVCYFLREKNETKQGESPTENKPNHGKTKRRWTSEDDSLLKDLHSQHLPLRDIAFKLDRSRIAIQHRIQTLGLSAESQAINKEVANEATNHNTPKPILNGSLKECLTCCLEICDKFPQATKILLREVSNRLELKHE